VKYLIPCENCDVSSQVAHRVCITNIELYYASASLVPILTFYFEKLCGFGPNSSHLFWLLLIIISIPCV
jgi:hypothetical protein